MNYTEEEKRIKKEVLGFTTFCLQIADMITPENRKDLINSIQKQTQTLYRNVVKG